MVDMYISPSLHERKVREGPGDKASTLLPLLLTAKCSLHVHVWVFFHE